MTKMKRTGGESVAERRTTVFRSPALSLRCCLYIQSVMKRQKTVPPQGESVSRAILTGLKQRGDTCPVGSCLRDGRLESRSLHLTASEPGPEGLSYQYSAGRTGPVADDRRCVCQ